MLSEPEPDLWQTRLPRFSPSFVDDGEDDKVYVLRWVQPLGARLRHLVPRGQM